MRPFDLSIAPLLRVGLIPAGENRHILAVDMHHIISDGTSVSILVNDFMALYSGEELPDVPLHYKDFSAWQQQTSVTESLNRQEAYWLNEFQGEIPVLALPTDYPRPAVQGFEGSQVSFDIDQTTTQALKNAAHSQGATLYIILLSFYALFLSRLSGQEDIVIGTPVAGREHSDLEPIIGMFVNTLALRYGSFGNVTFESFLQQLKEQTLNAFANQDYLYEDLVEKLSVKRDTGHNPLFDALFTLMNIDIPDLELPGLKIEPYDYKGTTTKFDLTLEGGESKSGLSFTFEYNTKLFKHETIQRFSRYFKRLLSQSLDRPRAKITGLEILSPEEKHQVLTDFNQTQRDYPKNQTIHQLFREQAERIPDHIAASESSGFISYKELDRRSDGLAFRLKEEGVESGSISAIMMEPSTGQVIGIIGILKAGGAYLPIDLDYPQERIDFMLKDSAAKVIITNGLMVERLNGSGEPTDKPTNLAYIMYTSGSTGRPKAVMVEHRNVVRLVIRTDYVEFRKGDKILRTGALSFDASTFEIWGALLNGLVLYSMSKEKLLTPGTLKWGIRNYGITTMWMTAPLFNRMLEEDIQLFTGLKNLLVGGDVLSPYHIQRLRERFPDMNIINGYGPTENTTFSTTHLIRETNGRAIPIGKPIANSTAYIVSRYGQPQPIGAAGELWVGGDGVSRGYLNNPELTNSKFDHDLKDFQDYHDFKKETPVKSAVIYKTGDLARWRPDGAIEFLGRIDTQVKIRGFRVELEEIQNRLKSFDQISDAVVIARETNGEDKSLYAYIVPAPTAKVEHSAVKEYLSDSLPDFMVPGHIIQLEKIPLTPNGKVDREALPKPGAESESRGPAVPVNKVQEQLAALWAGILGLEVRTIGIDDDFFQSGGHSLKATTLVSQIHKTFDVKISLSGIFETPTIRELAQWIDKEKKTLYQSIRPVEEREYYPQSSAQKRLFLVDRLGDTGTSYNIPYVLEVEGAFDIQQCEQAFRSLIRRHESLRTTFALIDHQPVQRIHDEVDFGIEYFSGHMLHDEHGQKRTKTGMIKGFVRPFDLSSGRTLFRAGVVKIEESSHLLMVDMHHIISDGTSVSVMVKDFTALYGGETLPASRIRYKDFSQWQNYKTTKESIKRQEAYWRGEFRDEIPLLTLPVDYPRPTDQRFEGNRVRFDVDPDVAESVKKYALTEGTTLYMVLLSLYTVLLSKLSGQEDIVAGTPVAGREHADLGSIMGMFVNTLPLRNYPRGDLTFPVFLGQVTKRTLEAFANQDYPYEELVGILPVSRDTGRNPLFDVMFALQNQETSNLELPGLTLTPYDFENKVSQFDLTLSATEIADGLFFSFEYAASLFREETVQRFTGYFKVALSGVLESPGAKLSDIEIIPPAEKEQLLVELNDTAAPYPENKTLHGLFREQVLKTPDNIALELNEEQLSYKKLNEQANRLAAVLIEKQTSPGLIVALLMERSIGMIIGLLGILQAGAAYLPIDPETPEKRVDFMLKDSAAKAIVTNGLMVKRLNGSNEPTNKPTNLAHVIYTSGSTGKPKGVMVEHRSVVNMACSQRKLYNIDQSDRVLQFSSLSFDASVEQLFIALFSGAAVVLIDKDTILDHRRFGDYIRDRSVTHIHAVPSFLNDIEVESTVRLKRIVSGGEVCPIPLVKKLSRYSHFYNTYGPTETTVTSLSLQCSPPYDPMPRLPIGKPIHNTQVYLFDRYRRLVPLGVAGELHIGGEGVARGYLNRPELTSASFFPSVKSAKSAVIYKTGDLARWLPDGKMEFLGRADHQVKVRGFRIELGEIESLLTGHEQIKEAVVLAKEDEKGETHLYAYFVSHMEVAPEALREYLAGELPAYMLPSFFIALDKIPLTANGKADRRNLEAMEVRAKPIHQAPRDTVEDKLATIWAEVLNIDKEKIGIETDFFLLGGHSLNATFLASKIHKEFQVKLEVAEIFKAPRIKAMATAIKRSVIEGYTPLEPVEEKEYYPLSSAQKRLYILHKLDTTGTVYNMPQIIPFNFPPDPEKPRNIFNQLILRHESFRTSFHTVDHQPVQKVHDRAEMEIQWYLEEDVQDVTSIMRDFVRPFDLSRAPLLRVGFVRTAGPMNLLLVDMHHIISDGASHKLLENEFTALYGNRTLPPLKFQYKDYVQWRNSPWQQTLVKQQETYWLNRFPPGEECPVLQMPIDYPRPPIRSFDGESVDFGLNENLTRQLKELGKETNSTLYMVILSIYTLLLSKLSGQEDIVTGTPIAGRTHDDLEHIIGMFVNTLPMRNFPAAGKTFKEYLADVRHHTLEAYANQEYPFEELVDKVATGRDTSRNPIFDAAFNLLNISDYTGDIPGDPQDSSSPQHTMETTRFDLGLQAMETGEEILCKFNYCIKLFKRETIERFIHYFRTIIPIAADNSETRLGEIQLLTHPERRRLLEDFNATRSEYSLELTLHQMFERQVERTPHHVAVVFEDRRLTYSALNNRANRLARLLREKGTGPDVPVALLFHRSLESVTATIATLKAGGAFLPMDPESPGERIRYMLEDSGAKILLTTGPVIKNIDLRSINPLIIPIEEESFADIAIRESSNPDTLGTPSSLEYIIYTSGTTGKPKGVLLEHGNLLNYTHWAVNQLKINGADKTILISPYAVDLSYTQFYATIVSGGEL
ncbi:MAG: amino acid adenylation domain-containing protein, partial [bacterium]|nr:amino acid adenylation domain-containing protein [bacterium]